MESVEKRVTVGADEVWGTGYKVVQCNKAKDCKEALGCSHSTASL